jgi:hypothetical protein
MQTKTNPAATFLPILNVPALAALAMLRAGAGSDL